MIKSALLVFLGGGLGSVCRYLISRALNSTGTNLPWGTFTVNILGSFLIGLFLGIAIKNNTLNSATNLILATGFCGGFTTFSTFSFENQALLRSGDYYNFVIYALATLIIGISSTFFGLFLSKIS
ncbi:fluoride efflux transporter CrcB [Zunongwangia endophytica]|uniref:Fluoride-specific ion channel FluC n=1 Tax=Zunongwangia endophytica TaxID=1808945 RepID=A0ABV8HBS2_9FLAO|nr:fluoride efflux transporter CrcB [Zunongwangia endophytica]MDN3593344.1 fluoride efflux transporter CrcB [Zunongwangia endophytica]